MDKKIILNLKIFFGSLFLSALFFGSINILQKNLENLFFQLSGIVETEDLTAQIIKEKNLPIIKITKNNEIEDLKIEAQSALSVFFDPQGNKKILFEKDSNKNLPIASLTKLMTALIIWENYDLSQSAKIYRNVPDQGGSFGYFKIGQVFKIKDLLYSMLIESSNDAVIAITDMIGENNFVKLMNVKTKEIGLNNTFFVNSTGLDPDTSDGLINYSTSQDLAILTNFILKNNPEIGEISAIPKHDLYLMNGIFHHSIFNTNKILSEFPNIVLSKTGLTPRAQGCLILAMKMPDEKGIIVNVVLGSSDRFNEMKKLINWINSAYQFEK